MRKAVPRRSGIIPNNFEIKSELHRFEQKYILRLLKANKIQTLKFIAHY